MLIDFNIKTKEATLKFTQDEQEQIQSLADELKLSLYEFACDELPQMVSKAMIHAWIDNCDQDTVKKPWGEE